MLTDRLPSCRSPSVAQSLLELVRRASRRGAPGPALAAIGELRRRLAELERAQVGAAVEQGWSWAVIGQHLGISKQAAHKKHRAALAATAGRAAPARLVIAGEARTAVRLAADAAARLGSRQVGPAHILLGVLETGRTSIGEQLEQAGLSQPRVREQLGRLFAGAGDQPRSLVDSSEVTQGPIPLAARGRAVLEGSLREAVRLQSTRLGVDHLLLALLRMSHGSAAELMRDLEVPRVELAATLEDALRA